MTSGYLDYLESKEWWDRRKLVLQRAGYRCEHCGSAGPLEIHHVRYDNLGDEGIDDLIALCRPCHRRAEEPRNRPLRVREQFGQGRLFDRWDDQPSIAWKIAA